MLLIRALHVRKFSELKGRFNSDSFRNLNGGISIFDYECSIKSTGSVCGHLSEFYNHIVGQPAFFCRFEFNDLVNDFQLANGQNIEIIQSDSDKGDKCHHDIVNFKDKLTDKFSQKYFQPPNIYVCCNGEEKRLGYKEFIILNQYKCA